MKLRFARALPISFLLLASNAAGQRGGIGTVAPPTQMGVASGAAAIIVTVLDENGVFLNRQALVKLTSDMGSPLWGTTGKQSDVQFDDIPAGTYEIEVDAAGYRMATRSIYIMSGHEVYPISILLTSEAAGAPPTIAPGQILVPKARKDAEKGITALKVGNLKEAEKQLRAAYKVAPTSADVNFLLGFLFLQKKDPGQAEPYLEKAASLDPKQVRALTALGQLRLAKKDYVGATAPLEQGIKADPQSWQAHWELADAYLGQNKFQKACDQAQLAVQTGKGAGNGAELLLGESLAYLGRTSDAIEALQGFLRDLPKSAVAPQVREMISQLQSHPAAVSAGKQLTVSLVSVASIARPVFRSSRDDSLPIPSWLPPDVDDEKPLVAPGVACPLQQVIAGAGKRAKELVDNISHFGATETMLHEDLNELGEPITKEKRKFDYIASVSEPKPGLLMVDEYRKGLSDAIGFPDNIATIGLPVLAMVFDPDMRDDFDMTCEGLGDWHGKAAWLVHFRQKASRPSRIETYEVGKGSYPVGLKGRAWIAASTFQVVRVESDLVDSMPIIQLLTQHQVVDYGPVEFKKKHLELWLPESADLYFEFQRHRYYRRHSFSDYILFSVDSDQKIKPPKMPEESEVSISQPIHPK